MEHKFPACTFMGPSLAGEAVAPQGCGEVRKRGISGQQYYGGGTAQHFSRFYTRYALPCDRTRPVNHVVVS